MAKDKEGDPLDGIINPNVNNGEPEPELNKSVLTLEQITKHLDENKDDRHKLFYTYKHYQSELDVQKKQHLKTWESNNLDGLLLERENKIRNELMPTETPAEKDVRRLTIENEKKDGLLHFALNKSKAIEYANSVGISVGDNIEWIIQNAKEDIEITKRIDWLKEYGDARERDGKNRIIAEHGTTPHAGDEKNVINDANFRQVAKTMFQKHGYNAMSKNPNLKKYLDEHPEKINEINK